MNLAALRNFCDNLLDYDPVNDTYTSDLTALLNDAQRRLLGDRAWDFLISEQRQRVQTDVTATLTFTNGSPNVTGTGFPFSSDPINPGSRYELGVVDVTDSAGVQRFYTIRFVESTTLFYVDRPFEGVSGAYACTIRFRDVYLPADTAQLQGELKNDLGYPMKLSWLSQFSRDSYELDPDLLGTPESVLEGESIYVPAPRKVTGVTAATVSAGQGVRTVTVYMVNVWCPDYDGFNSYPGYSGGFESALSPGLTFELTDTQELNLTPEAIQPDSGLYRRYYVTCEAEGIKAPRRLRQATTGGGRVAGEDTINPNGTITLVPDTSLATLQSQAFDASVPRYQRTQGGAHRALQLYPHPSSDTTISVRRLRAPQDMEEDQDAAAIPSSSATIIAYEAMLPLALKLDQAALATSWERQSQRMFRGMEQRYISKPSRRIIKGNGPEVYPTMFGPLTFT